MSGVAVGVAVFPGVGAVVSCGVVGTGVGVTSTIGTTGAAFSSSDALYA